jgi:hypothetical protein
VEFDRVQLLNLQNENKTLKLEQEQNHKKISQKNEEIDQLLVVCRALKEQLQFQVELDRNRVVHSSNHGLSQPSSDTKKPDQHTLPGVFDVGPPASMVSHHVTRTDDRPNPPVVVQGSTPVDASVHSTHKPDTQVPTKSPSSASRSPTTSNEKTTLKRAPSFKRLSQTLPIVPEVDTAMKGSTEKDSPTTQPSESKISKVTRSMSPEFRDFFRRSQELRSRTSSTSSIGSGKVRSSTHVHNNHAPDGPYPTEAKSNVSILDEKPTFLLQDVQKAKTMLDSLDNQIQDLEHLFQ